MSSGLLGHQRCDFVRPIELARRSLTLLPKRTKSMLSQFEASTIGSALKTRLENINARRRPREKTRAEIRREQNDIIIAAALRGTAKRERKEKIAKSLKDFEKYLKSRKPGSKTNLDNMPSEIINLIFDDLNNNEVVCLSLVCKDIRAVYDKSMSVTDGLCYHSWDDASPTLMTLLADWFPIKYAPCLDKQKFILRDSGWVDRCPCLECTFRTGRIWGKAGLPRRVYVEFDDGRAERLSIYAARF